MSRSGLSAITCSIAARVSSVEPPSTKTSSAAAPSSGSRPTSSGTLPASLRHGHTTDTVSSSSLRVCLRAAIHQVRQRWLSGQMLATKPFRKSVSSGICFGISTRRVCVTTSKSASASRLRTSSGATQLRIGFGGLSRSSSASRMIGRQTRLYEWTTTRVSACEWATTRSKSAIRSCTYGTRSERTT